MSSKTFQNPIQLVDDISDPDSVYNGYTPVYDKFIVNPILNNYFLNECIVGTIVFTKRNYLPLDNWIECDGSVIDKEGHEQLYERIAGMFGDYSDTEFTIPEFDYTFMESDSNIVAIIKYYKRQIGRGGHVSSTDS